VVVYLYAVTDRAVTLGVGEHTCYLRACLAPISLRKSWLRRPAAHAVDRTSPGSAGSGAI
jgi:hypothetical protein